jgi:hypothetical protein
MPKPADAPADAEAPRRTVDLPGVPQDDEPRAKRVALLVSDSLRRGEAAPLGSDETVAQWFARYYDAAASGEVGRKNRGAPQVSAGDRRRRFDRWIAPGQKKHAGRKPGLAAKAARNIWGELTAAFREAHTSKIDDLRVRADDPTRGVQPPSSADDRELAALYPSELAALLAAPTERSPSIEGRSMPSRRTPASALASSADSPPRTST